MATSREDSVQEGLQLGGIFTLFLSLFLFTIATAANSWQTSTGRNYYFNIGIWKWCALSKTNDNATICGNMDQKDIYSDEVQQNAVVQVRYLTCFATGMLTLSMLFMLGDKKKFVYMAAFSALISFILAITAISIYSSAVWDKAELVNNMDNVNPTSPEWGYGFSFWFFVASIALAAIAFVILIVYAKMMVDDGSTSVKLDDTSSAVVDDPPAVKIETDPAAYDATPVIPATLDSSQ